MAMFNSKKKEADIGLDVLEDIKEPFSFASFYETYIVENIKKIKKMLDERGILFFFLSPFQQRNRLIIQLVLIIFGILAGVIPRSMQLINNIREQNANSEMAGLIEKGTVINTGSINIKPLMSSQYDKQHVLAFLITPSQSQVIPSIPERYFINISGNTRAEFVDKITFSYDVIPTTTTDRLLLIYTDHREQADDAGMYDIIIENKEDNLDMGSKHPVTVVLSNTQKTTRLFDETGIHLDALSNVLFNDDNQPIQTAKDNLKAALSDYTLEVERVQNQPIDMNPIPSPAALEAFAYENELYPSVGDKSDVADLAEIEEISPEERDMSITYKGAIEVGGIKYDSDSFSSPIGEEAITLTEQEELIQTELESLQQAIDKVLGAVKSLNTATMARFDLLKSLELIFSQSFDPTSFTNTRHATTSMMSFEQISNAETEVTSEETEDASTEAVTSEETESTEVETSEEVSDSDTTSEETSTEVITSEEVSTEAITSEEPPVVE